MKKYWWRFHAKCLQKVKLNFIRWFYSKYPGKYCWADCVAWSFATDRFNPFKIDNTTPCEIESEKENTCYCGCWYDGKCFDLLPKQEQEKIKRSTETISF